MQGEGDRVSGGGVVILSEESLITNYELLIEILRHFVPQKDNTDGRRQMADNRYRVVGNRRPLRCVI